MFQWNAREQEEITYLLPGFPGKGILPLVVVICAPVSDGIGALKRDETGRPWLSSKFAI